MIDFRSWTGRGRAALLGLDIGSCAVRVVELVHGTGGLIRLERCAAEPLPHGAVVDGKIERPEQVVEAARRACKNSGSAARLAALAMPSAVVISRKITVPAGISAQQLEAQVQSEAAQYLPYALDEVSFDFDVLGRAAAVPDEVEVLLAAARRELVEARVAVAEACGLKATVMDIEACAAQAAFERVLASAKAPLEGQVCLLFQIGAQLTQIVAMCDGVVIYEGEQPFGGQALTQAMVRAYGMIFDEAEMRKKTVCLPAVGLPADYDQRLLAPFLDNAALELARAVQFFYAATPYSRVERLYLGGGCALMPGLAELVASRTGIASAVLSPFQGMQLGRMVREGLPAQAPAYLVACGLALRRFD